MTNTAAAPSWLSCPGNRSSGGATIRSETLLPYPATENRIAYRRPRTTSPSCVPPASSLSFAAECSKRVISIGLLIPLYSLRIVATRAENRTQTDSGIRLSEESIFRAAGIRCARDAFA